MKTKQACDPKDATIAELGTHIFTKTERSAATWVDSGEECHSTKWLIDAGAKFYRGVEEPKRYEFGGISYFQKDGKWHCFGGAGAGAAAPNTSAMLNALKSCGYFDEELQGWLDQIKDAATKDKGWIRSLACEAVGRLLDHRRGKGGT